MSSRTAASPRRRLYQSIAALALIALVFCLYRMFDYALTWSSGWKPVPDAAAPVVEFVDPSWAALAKPAGDVLRAARDESAAPAVSAAISIDGQRVWAAALGFADVDAGKAVQLDSSFRLGSTAKAINSVALGTLLDAQRIDLDAPVRTYLPDIGEPLGAITTRQAISHTAGVRDYGLCMCFPVWEQFNRRAFGPRARAGLEVFAHDPLLFTPGSGFAYSSYGANVAGAVIEAVAGVDYTDYVDNAVFEPLSMADSSADFNDRPMPQRVQFYDVQEGRYKPAYAVDNSIKWPSGGMLSTPSDLLKLGEAMLDPLLFSAATRDLLITPQKLADGSDNEQGYALGWRYSDQKKLFDNTMTTRIYSHHGTAVGSLSYFAVYPDHGLVVSMMMNRSGDSVDALAAQANRLVEPFIAERQRRAQMAPE